MWQPFYPSCHKLLYRTSTQPIWYLTIQLCELSQIHVCPASPSPCLSVKQGLMHSRLPFMQPRMTFTPDFCLHVPDARIKGILPNLLLLLLLKARALSEFSFVLNAPWATQQMLSRELAIQMPPWCYHSKSLSEMDEPCVPIFWSSLQKPGFCVSSQVLWAHSLPRSVKTSLKY